MQLTNVLLSTLAGTAAVSARVVHPVARQGCNIVEPNEDVFSVAAGSVDKTTTLTYNIGSGYTGPCTLFGKFPAGTIIDTTTSEGANNRLNIVNAAGSSIGSFPPLAVDAQSRLVSNTFAVINSVTCAPELSFTFNLANDAGSTGIDNLAFDDLETGTGFLVQVGDGCPLPTF